MRAPDTTRRIAQADLVANARGIAFAAFAPTATIADMLGCSIGEAEIFQADALSDFTGLQLTAQRTRQHAS